MGLEVESYSELPMGSGLGTSSILAGCVLAAIGGAAGLSYDHSSLVHAVLTVEQARRLELCLTPTIKTFQNKTATMRTKFT